MELDIVLHEFLVDRFQSSVVGAFVAGGPLSDGGPKPEPHIRASGS